MPNQIFNVLSDKGITLTVCSRNFTFVKDRDTSRVALLNYTSRVTVDLSILLNRKDHECFPQNAKSVNSRPGLGTVSSFVTMLMDRFSDTSWAITFLFLT